MNAMVRRLRRLEQLRGPAPESGPARRLQARMDAARQRCKLPPIPSARVEALCDRSIVDILLSGRQRARRPAKQCEEAAIQYGCSDDRDRG